jgi:beta-N-acetylhexosaminidase
MVAMSEASRAQNNNICVPSQQNSAIHHDRKSSDRKINDRNDISVLEVEKSIDIKSIVAAMTLEEKIGQKIMMDARRWKTDEKEHDMTEPNQDIASMMTDNHIGGVILFSNNLKNDDQIKKLTTWLGAIKTKKGLPLFIGTDNEGGNVFRLPQENHTAFPGNMALTAAMMGGARPDLAFDQGKYMARAMKSLNINTNFAPVVDVNSNPTNPVINVRAFSDNAETVAELAEQFVEGMHSENMVTTYKHFPGHGDTSTDSHSSLPRVDRNRQDAFAIDIYPYKKAIEQQLQPDMVMTAHIQYPALDNSVVLTKNGEEIIIPATMSRKIQTDILRHELGFSGVIISDALNMGAISEHYTPEMAIVLVFKAGVDIALMPIKIDEKGKTHDLSTLINFVANKVKSGEINEAELTESVERILHLKQARGLLDSHQPSVAGEGSSEKISKEISDRSITLIVNHANALPLQQKEKKIFVLAAGAEQAQGLGVGLTEQGFTHVTTAQANHLTADEVISAINNSDIFIVGTLATKLSAVENDGFHDGQTQGDKDIYHDYMQHAKKHGKTVIHVSLRVPYDVVQYINDAHASLAVYSSAGYVDHIWRGTSMRSLAEVLTGKIKPQGKLPVDTYIYDAASHTRKLAYARGYGLPMV